MKTMTISAFRSHISAELRKVRKGGRIIISDRDTPIAEVVPFNAERATTVTIRAPTSGPFVVPRSSISIHHDPVEYLLEDRDK